MRKLILTVASLLPFFLMAAEAKAQNGSGWTRPLETNADGFIGPLPPVNQPQPGWSPESDLQDSDGTVAVPACSDPTVLATVQDGILDSINQQTPPAVSGGQTWVSKAMMSTVWVHPTVSNGTICDTEVQTDMIGTGPEEWEFEAFSVNGEVKVFFYDKDDQGN